MNPNKEKKGDRKSQGRPFLGKILCYEIKMGGFSNNGFSHIILKRNGLYVQMCEWWILSQFYTITDRKTAKNQTALTSKMKSNTTMVLFRSVGA